MGGPEPAVRIRSASREDPLESAQVASVARLLSQKSVLRAPEQVGIEPGARFASEHKAPVVVLDHALWGAARHRPPRGTGRRRDGLPWFGLTLADHQPPTISRRPLDHASGTHRPGVLAGAHVRS